jgi:hypothetical protein
MSEQNNDKSTAKLKITVDNKATEQLVDYLREKDEEKELEQEKKPEPSLNDLIVQFTREYGRGDLWTQATSKEMLKDMFKSWVNDNADSKSKTGDKAGSAPLNEAQYGRKPESLWTKPYESYEEMIADLREKSHNGSKEAESYLNMLFERFRDYKRIDPTKADALPSRNAPENMLDLHLIEKNTPVGTFVTPQNKEDSDFGKVLRKWHDEWRRTRQPQQVGNNQ